MVSKVFIFPSHVNPRMKAAKVKTPSAIYPPINVLPAEPFTAWPNKIPIAMYPRMRMIFLAMLNPLEEKNVAPMSSFAMTEIRINTAAINNTTLMKR